MAENKAFPGKENDRLPEALAKEAAAGNEESFSLLAKAFTPALIAMVSPLSVPPAEKEDLMQEGLIGLYKAVRLYDPSLSSFPAFARLCMRSAVLDGVRKYRKADLEKADPDELIPDSPDKNPERILIGREELRELLQKVDRSLSPMERRIFGLRLRGKSVSEIASVTGKEKKSVENALYRLRKKLSEAL